MLYLSGEGVMRSSTDKVAVMRAFQSSKRLWQSDIVEEAETDFNGAGEFTNVSPGDYWVTGVAETRGGVALWNHKVSIKRGDNKILLSQNNAAFSK